jgi:putative addiction module component (TIGR02574 family)
MGSSLKDFRSRALARPEVKKAYEELTEEVAFLDEVLRARTEAGALTESLLRQALELPANERATLIEGLIISLDKPDPAVDALWLKEAESRMAAYRSGDLDAVDADQVFAELGRQS